MAISLAPASRTVGILYTRKPQKSAIIPLSLSVFFTFRTEQEHTKPLIYNGKDSLARPLLYLPCPLGITRDYQGLPAPLFDIVRLETGRPAMAFALPLCGNSRNTRAALPLFPFPLLILAPP